MIRRGLRALEIAWTFLRHGVVGAVYRDVVRSHLTNPHCGCEADEAVSGRARRLREALEALGPTFVKLGQFLSRRPDLVPPAYLDELIGLQDRMPPVPYGEIRARLEDVCICGHHGGTHPARSTCLHCRGVDGVFEGFQREPLASASLAQVHRARYGGREVAVKVLKPRVLDRLNLDLSLLDRSRWIVGRLLGVERNMPVSDFVDEFRRRLLEEVNFENEALNIARFRDTHPDDGEVVAPSVHWEFDRADLLVMDYLDGTALSRWSGSPDERRRVAQALGRDFARQVFLDNYFHADPHPGNVLVLEDGGLAYLDFGAVGELEPRTRRSVLKLLRSILREDPDLAVDAVLEAGGTDPDEVDRDELRGEVGRIIQLYRRKGGVRWTDEVIETARRHRIRLPRSILSYAKATVLTESLLAELDPEFELLPVIRSLAGPLLEKELAELAQRIPRELPELPGPYVDLLRDLPGLLRSWLEREGPPEP